MRLEEIDPNKAAAEQVKRQKAAAKAARDRANQLKAQADTAAARLATLKSRQKLAQPKGSPATSTIKPTGPS